MGCQLTSPEQTSTPCRYPSRQKKTKLIDSRRKSTMISDRISENVIIIKQILEKQYKDFAIKCLSEHQFFSTLKDQEIQQITKSMTLVEGKQNEYIFHQGDPGNSFFIVYDGQVDVQIDDKYVRTLAKGQSFGQLALLFKTQRTASLKCKGTKNIFLAVKPASFRQSLKKMRIYEFERNKRMVQSVQIFQALTNKQKQQISQNLKSIRFPRGEIIFKQGDSANEFYIISSGQVRIQVEGKKSIILKTFESFGQNAFRPNSKRIATAICLQQTVCCFLTKSDLDNIFGNYFHNIFYFNIKKWALLRSEIFRNQASLINKLIPKFQIKKAADGQILAESMPTGLIIPLEGTINGKPEGSLFCEKNYQNRNLLCHPLIKNEAGNYAYLSFQTIDNTLREVEQKNSFKNYSKKSIPTDKENIQIFNLCQCQFLKELGEGQFGKVYLVKNKGYMGNLYAIKCLSKQAIQKQSMEKCVIQEKRILSRIVFPYIVGFAQAFHDQKNIYFLMQYIRGKQMFDVIRQMPFLNRKIVTYFFGCILLAIEHLHQNNIIYRDVKPENSIVDHTGKVFLVDLGTAKILKKQTHYKTFTLIGTPHYMAPETFQANGYSFEVDTWALGVLLYEFLFARLPFGEEDSDPYIVMKKIKTQTIVYPESAYVSREAKEVLQLLLQKNPNIRAIKGSFQNIKKCPYFSAIDWNQLMHENIEPPYIPKHFRKQNQHPKSIDLDGKPFGEFLYGKSFVKNKWKVELWNEQFSFK